MRLPSFGKALRLARVLTVLDQKTGALVPFVLNRGQRRILKKVLRTKRLVIGKGRQVGSTTVCAFVMLLAAICNPGLPMAIVADEQEKANGVLGKIKGWLGQLGFSLTVAGVESITLENGASIDALTAISNAENGESRVGRSKSYGFILATEMAFWRNARAVWAALTSTILTSAIIIAESTGAAGETLFRELLEGDGWDKYFVSVEDHENYRADPSEIDDARWAYLQAEYGFTRRESAAWWWKKLNDDLKGDVFRMLREYPVLVAHMFTYREGQHIRKWKAAADVITDGLWNFYRPVDATDPPVIGVDTSLGLGDDADGIENDVDASAMWILGQRTGLPYATWRSYGTPIVQYTRHVLQVIEDWNPIAFVVETNGCGTALWGGVMHVRGAFELNAGNISGEVQKRRDMFRDAIEAGKVPIGPHAIEEAKQSVVVGRRLPDGRVKGVFEGHDDVLSAGSFAWQWRHENPWRAGVTRLSQHRFVDRSAVRRKKARKLL